MFGLRSLIESITEHERDYEGLARKIRDGVPIRDAAKQCGIPEGELLEYVVANLQKPAELSFEIKRMAESALTHGMKKLRKIAEEGPRIGDTMSKYNNTDLEAAQTLSKIGFEMLKLSVSVSPEGKARGLGATLTLDVWDQPGAWDLKKPGA